ncbi:MAG: glycine--tRNA ligase [Candidatus Aenigmarchaeota archaeon]|nr:glycine--tRNA ligase [Candidatus Aenigmarchaeota archaeon]
MDIKKDSTKSEKIEDLAKRRGFFNQSSEIYGSLSGLYDYGFLGASLKRKWEALWRKHFLDEDFAFEIETTNIMPEPVFRASGHLENFIDPTTRCKKCGTVHRADHIIEEFLGESFEGLSAEKLTEIIHRHRVKCPKCKGQLEDAATLNMMFPLTIGTGEGTKPYLRPETAQGVYVNFSRAFEQLRKKLPLGLALIGKAYRNEISPRNLLIRQREFTQAELQIFFDPERIGVHERFEQIADYKLRLFTLADKKSNTITEITCKDAAAKLKLPQFYVYHLAKIQKFYLDVLKLPIDKFRFRELSEEERAFYNRIHWDIEINLESLGGFKEIGGLHYRTDHDLKGHGKISGKDMSISIDDRRFIPNVLELSFGVDRNVYALLDLSYHEEGDEKDRRIVLRLPQLLSPFDFALFPLVNKDNIPEKAQEIKKMLKEKGFGIFYDDSGSIGRRYRRMDEIGVAKCITIDHQTLEDSTVTIRDRDTMTQIRVKIDDISSYI